MFTKRKKQLFSSTNVHIWDVRTLLAMLQTFWLSSLYIMSIFGLLFYKVVNQSSLKGYIFQVALLLCAVKQQPTRQNNYSVVFLLWNSLTS